MTAPETCIYCGEHKPFTAEHVVSAGIGGDDPDWLLTDCVCGDCNTKVFSPLEAKTFRSSPLALSRIYLQPQTRSRTGKASVPTIQPQADYHVDPDTGIRFEQITRAGGQPVMLPQIAVTLGGEIIVNLPSVDVGKEFFAVLRERLAPAIRIVKKLRDGVEVRFDQIELLWSDDTIGYTATGVRESSLKAPRGNVFWLEEPIWPNGVEVGDFSKLPPRIFRREGGQICCRVLDEEIAISFLSMMKHEIANLSIPADAAPISSHALTSQKYAFDTKIYNRVLAKIGLNLCAKLFGADFARQHPFDRIREFVLTGEGGIFKRFVTDDDKAKNLFGPPLKHHHAFMISVGPGNDSSTRCVVFFSRLYSGPIEITRLAEFPTDQLNIPDRTVVVVDYHADKIEQMDLESYVLFAVQNSFVPIEEFLDQNSPG